MKKLNCTTILWQKGIALLIAVALLPGKVSGASTRNQAETSLKMSVKTDVVVIGAGLAGLTCAMKLVENGVSCTVLDARHRLGGRIVAEKDRGAIDLGPAWTWPSNDVQLEALTGKVGVEIHPQRNNGKDLRAPGMVFRSYWESGTYRFAEHGTAKLVDAIAERIPAVQLGSVVEKIAVSPDPMGPVTVQYRAEDNSTSEITARAVVIAAPPRVTRSKISFSPELPDSVSKIMETTPTWMSDTMKVVAVFTKPVWEDQGLSGAAFPQGGGPLSQIWDNSWHDSGSGQGKTWYALGGFVMGTHCVDLQGADEQTVRNSVIGQLESLFGPQVESEMISISFKNWMDDEWVTPRNFVPPKSSLGFGHPLLREPLFDGRVILSGTETETEHGHMEGAVRSGNRAAKMVLEKFGVC